MKLVIIGPQAAGKGTQSQLLCKEFGLTHISLGERLRQEVASGSHLGELIKDKINHGELVPDEYVESIIRRLAESSHGNFILDGFPRTESQAQWLDKNIQIDKVIVLNVADKVSVERIGGRVECPKGHDYHIIHKPPRKPGFCDEDGLPLRPRTDDAPAAIMKRLQTYHQQTEPLIKRYKDKVITINGEQQIMDVHRDILRGLKAKPL